MQIDTNGFKALKRIAKSFGAPVAVELLARSLEELAAESSQDKHRAFLLLEQVDRLREAIPGLTDTQDRIDSAVLIESNSQF